MRQLNKNLKEIIGLIMKQQDLLKLLHYEDNNVDVTKLDDLTSNDKKTVRNNNIYEYRKLPTSNYNEMKSYIAIEYGIVDYGGANRRSTNPCFNNPEIIFYVVTHNSLDNNLIIGSRVNEIENILGELFHMKFKLDNVGMCRMSVSNRLNLPNDFVGREIHMTFVDNNIGI